MGKNPKKQKKSRKRTPNDENTVPPSRLVDDITELEEKLIMSIERKKVIIQGLEQIDKAEEDIARNEKKLAEKTEALEKRLKEYLNGEDLEDFQATISMKEVKKILTQKFPVMLTVMLIMAQSITITKAEDNQGIFKPVGVQEEPLFQLTANGEIVQVEKENLAITIQTHEKGPYLMKRQEHKTMGYKCIKNVLDLSNIAIPLHNSKMFLEQHQEKQSYFQQQGFKSFQTGGKYSREYIKIPGSTAFDNCEISCKILNATMPEDNKAIKEAAQLLGLTTEYMWVKTTQLSEKRSDWSWKHVFNYKLYLNQKQIFPKEDLPMRPLNFPLELDCKPYRHQKLVTEKQIGYHYDWYHEGVYHTVQPLRLEVGINKDLACLIIVPYMEHTLNARLDDHTCVCTREKHDDEYTKNKLEVSTINHQLEQGLNNISIEDWRFKTHDSSVSILDNVHIDNEKLEPRYTKYNKIAVKTMQENYVNLDDLTTLKINTERTMDVKAKDAITSLVKGITKLAISNPHLIKNLHQEIRRMLSQDKQTTLVPTKNMVGSNEVFVKKINQMVKDFEITKNNSVIQIKPTSLKTTDWSALSFSDNIREAEQGIIQAKQVVLTTLKFQNILPQILRNLLIPRHYLEDSEVNFEEDTIIQYKVYKSYIELKMYIPIKMNEITTTYTFAPLPYQHQKDTDHFLIKELPESISIQPGSPSTVNMTPCVMELMKSSQKTTMQCKNEQTRYKEINYLMKLGMFNVFLFQKLGTISISCPQDRIHFYDLQQELNVFLVHQSCYMEAKGGNYQLTIKPNITQPPSGLSILFLLSYTLEENWVPKLSTRWILQILTFSMVGLLFCLIGCCLIIIIKKKPWYCKVNIGNKTEDTSFLSHVQECRKKLQRKTEPVIPKVEEDKNKHTYHVGYDQYDTEFPISMVDYNFEEDPERPYQEYYKSIRKNRQGHHVDNNQDPQRSHHDNDSQELFQTHRNFHVPNHEDRGTDKDEKPSTVNK